VLSPAQRNCTTTEKEILAITTATRLHKSMPLSSNKKTIFYSNHRNLLSFQKFQADKPRHTRWLENFLVIPHDIKFIAGKHNYVADTLSRPFS
jgi:RNase H-like domain found in reverse transcriptase